jgi:hypothetical protein
LNGLSFSPKKTLYMVSRLLANSAGWSPLKAPPTQ